MTGGNISHPQVSYQVASKQELEVIYEGVQPRPSRTVWIVLAVLVSLLCLGGGAGLALWQTGLLGGDSQPSDTSSSSSSIQSQPSPSPSPITTTRTTTTTSSPQTSSSAVQRSRLVPVPVPEPEPEPESETTLILDKGWEREDHQLMASLGSPGTIIGKWRRKKHETTCTSLETEGPSLTKYLGNAFLPGIDGVVSCGYEEKEDGKREQTCYIFYRNRGYWHRVLIFRDRVMFEGASLPWHDKLVIVGGNHLLGDVNYVTRAIWVFTFNPVKDYFGDSDFGDSDSAIEGSGDLYSDDEELSEEGSGTEDVDVMIHVVEDSDHVLTEYGPGAVSACAVSLEETRTNVVFVVTGGKNQEGVTLDSVMRLQLDSNHGREPTLGQQRQFLPPLRLGRRRHGCTKTHLNGEDVIVVAGGLDDRNFPVADVEFLNIEENKKWKTLGQLKHPIQDFPTVGRILGHLVVVGGWNQYQSDGDIYNIDNGQTRTVISTELYDETKSQFRVSLPSDDLSMSPVPAHYHYYGVMFPKRWCKMY